MEDLPRKTLRGNPKACGARTRSGHSCPNPATKGSQRCRMHGGAKGSGRPLVNGNYSKYPVIRPDWSGFFTQLAMLSPEEFAVVAEAIMHPGPRLYL